MLSIMWQARQISSRAAVRIAASGDEGKYDFDLFTIGAGTGGVRASRFAANYGGAPCILQLTAA